VDKKQVLDGRVMPGHDDRAAQGRFISGRLPAN
jgi:hypothetical protein